MYCIGCRGIGFGVWGVQCVVIVEQDIDRWQVYVGWFVEGDIGIVVVGVWLYVF